MSQVTLFLHHLFLVIHIISAGFWVSQIPVEFVLNRLIRGAAGTPREMAFRQSRGELLGFLGGVGGQGILISGLGLIATLNWGLLGVTYYTPPWLIFKQIFYIIALVVVFGFIRPAAARIETQMKAAAGSGTPPAEVLALDAAGRPLRAHHQYHRRDQHHPRRLEAAVTSPASFCSQPHLC